MCPPSIRTPVPRPIADPPPKPTIRSGWNSSISPAPRRTVPKDGSGSTPRITLTCTPASQNSSSTFASIPLFSILLPPTTILALWASMLFIYSRLPAPNINSEPASFIGLIIIFSLLILIRLILFSPGHSRSDLSVFHLLLSWNR